MTKGIPTFETDRLLLRRIVADDIHYVYKGLSNPEVVKYYGVSFQSLKATLKQMDWYEDLEKKGKGQWWTVCARGNKTFYGACGLNNADHKSKKAEVGFWLLPLYWGHGIMSEALGPILQFGFMEWSLHRIEAFVEPPNKPCKKVLKKLGFEHEGTMQKCEVKDGQFIDLELYAKLKNELETKRHKSKRG